MLIQFTSSTVFFHIFGCAGIQDILHHQLFRTTHSSKGSLQARIGFQAHVDFHHALGTSQYSNLSVNQLTGGTVLDGLLSYFDLLNDRLEHFELFHLSSRRRQRRMTGKIGFDKIVDNRLVSGGLQGNSLFSLHSLHFRLCLIFSSDSCTLAVLVKRKTPISARYGS